MTTFMVQPTLATSSPFKVHADKAVVNALAKTIELVRDNNIVFLAPIHTCKITMIGENKNAR